jgi:RHS repeat-associated protein
MHSRFAGRGDCGVHIGGSRLLPSHRLAGEFALCLDSLPHQVFRGGIRAVWRKLCRFRDPDLNFTGQNQDTVFGLHDFLFREYHPVSGRWIQPDPAGLGAVNMANPQTWNRYAYVGNNPVNATDPLGLRASNGSDVYGGFDCSIDGMGAPCALVDSLASGGGGGEFGVLCAICSSWGYGRQWTVINGLLRISTTTTIPGGDGGEDHVPVETILRSQAYFLLQTSIGDPANNDSWAWTFTKSFFGDFSLKPTGKAGKYRNCVENNRMDNAVRSLATAYGHPQLGNILAGATLGGAGASALNAGANYTFGASVPGLFGLSDHSSTWLRALGYRTAGRAVSAASAVMLVGEGAYDATAMVRCAVTD